MIEILTAILVVLTAILVVLAAISIVLAVHSPNSRTQSIKVTQTHHLEDPQ